MFLLTAQEQHCVSPRLFTAPQLQIHKSLYSSGSKRDCIDVSRRYCWAKFPMRFSRFCCFGRGSHTAFCSASQTVLSEKITLVQATEKERVTRSGKVTAVFCPNSTFRAADKSRYWYPSTPCTSAPEISKALIFTLTAFISLSVKLQNFICARILPVWLSFSKAPAAISNGLPCV